MSNSNTTSRKSQFSNDDNGWVSVSTKKNSRQNTTEHDKGNKGYGKKGMGKGKKDYTGEKEVNSYNSVKDDKGSKKDQTYIIKDDKAQKSRLFYATKKIDDIMSISNGNIYDIETSCIYAFNSVHSKEEKAKIVETLVSYSLHELFDKTKFFGKIISTDMSVNASLDSIKERDGYDVFTWAIWTRYGDKRNINNLSRDNNDVIKTVQKLIDIKVSPFHINNKSESIIYTLESCIKNSKITTETRDVIYSIVLDLNNDSKFIFECIRTNLFDIFREGIAFNKTLVLWAIQNDEVFEMICDMAFKHDMDRVGLADIHRATAEIEYFTLFKKIIELINCDKYHPDFTKFFSYHCINKSEMTKKIAEFYMDKIFETIPLIYEYNVSDGYGSSIKEGICFKNMESIGAFIWDVSEYVEINEDFIDHLNIKMKIGYGIRGLKANRSNIEMLINMHPTVHIVSQILIENAFRSVNIPFLNVITSKMTIKEEKVDYFKNLKTGLEKIGNNKIIFSPEISDPNMDDAMYSLIKIKDKVDQIDFARAFTYQACSELFSDNQIKHIVPLIQYLDNKNIINKISFNKILEERNEILEDIGYDNPNAFKIINAFESSCM